MRLASTVTVNPARPFMRGLVDAPDRESANLVHREAHGLEALVLFEVRQGA